MSEQPAPYTCKHRCERDELKDHITALEAENKALREGLEKIAHNPSECTTGEGHAHAVFLARALLAKEGER